MGGDRLNCIEDRLHGGDAAKTERENRELRQANEIPPQGERLFCRAELDRRSNT